MPIDLDALIGRVVGKTKKAKKPAKSYQHSNETVMNYLEADGVEWEHGVFFYTDPDGDDDDANGVIWLSVTKPSEAVRTRLKAAGMRWYPPKGVWYLPKTRYSPLSELPRKKVAAFKKAIGFTPAWLAGES